jgi:hypothetical protein
MRLFLFIALVLWIFALIVAAGTTFVTGWNVWLIAGLIAFGLDILFEHYGTVGPYTYTRRQRSS